MVRIILKASRFIGQNVKPPTTSKSQTTWNVLRFLWWPVFLSKKMWPPTEDEGGDCWRQCGPTGSQRNITIQVPFAFGGGESWEITQFVEYQLRGYILPKLWEPFVSVFPSPLEFTQWLLCRIWKTRRNQGCELDLKRYLKVYVYHNQIIPSSASAKMWRWNNRTSVRQKLSWGNSD